mmetsp:Transcript_55681/g.120300  ORF Transcript_55681/g.120300 Transcript_55681/m.120300 type:complete len:218 (+) Transcript_55681:346-999(+)
MAWITSALPWLMTAGSPTGVIRWVFGSTWMVAIFSCFSVLDSYEYAKTFCEINATPRPIISWRSGSNSRACVSTTSSSSSISIQVAESSLEVDPSWAMSGRPLKATTRDVGPSAVAAICSTGISAKRNFPKMRVSSSTSSTRAAAPKARPSSPEGFTLRAENRQAMRDGDKGTSAMRCACSLAKGTGLRISARGAPCASALTRPLTRWLIPTSVWSR